MNLSGLVSALLPVFFVLALGYAAGKRNAFSAEQAAGLSKLAITFALPASLLVSMTQIPKSLLLQQGPLLIAILVAHLGLFFVAWAVLGFVKSLRGAPTVLYALMLVTSATPVFGLAVLSLSSATIRSAHRNVRSGDQPSCTRYCRAAGSWTPPDIKPRQTIELPVTQS